MSHLFGVMYSETEGEKIGGEEDGKESRKLVVNLFNLWFRLKKKEREKCFALSLFSGWEILFFSCEWEERFPKIMY